MSKYHTNFVGKSKGDNIFTRKIMAVIILIILYIFTGIFAQDRIINPFEPTKFLINIETLVAAASAIIFGSAIGAVIGGLGYFMLEIVLRLMGVTTSPLGVTELTHALSYAVGNWVIGWFGRTREKKTTSFTKIISDPKMWYDLAVNTMSVIFGLSIVSNLLIGVFEGPRSITEMVLAFLSRFYYSVQTILIILPVVMLLYYSIQVIREKRVQMLDELYHDLDIEIDRDGPAEIVDISFQDHALQIGRWTPIDVEFRHTWKAPRSYEIEAVSTSKLYPHKEVTSVLDENEQWTHTIYVQALEQDHVDVRLRINPAHTIKYKENPQQQTEALITGKTYVQRDLLLIGVIILSEVVITFFLFSLLWNQLATIFAREILGSSVAAKNLNNLSIPWNLLLVIAIIESILFIPFLTIMYRVQKPTVPQHFDEVLAFSADIQTHRYDGEVDNNSLLESGKKIIILPIANLVLIVISTLLTIELFDISSQLVNTGVFPIPAYEIVLLTGFTLVLWIITLYLLNNTTNIFSWDNNISIQSGKYITDVESLGQLKIHSPTEILFKVRNVSGKPGIRIDFESSDAISPPVIELHIDPGESAFFKVSITPQTTGTQEILAVIYPLFNEEKEYLPKEDCQPITSQNISYKVLGQTIVGITHSQARTLRHIFGWGSLLTTTIALANEYVGLEEAIRQWQETVPFLATIQIPFLYLYYLFSNKFLTDIQAY